MLTVLIIVILIACVLLVGVILIQNPKGGGLSSTFGGMSNQIMGVQRTTDFLEKSTWTLMGAIALLSILSVFMVGKPTVNTVESPSSTFENQDIKTPMPTAPAPAPAPAPTPQENAPAQ